MADLEHEESLPTWRGMPKITNPGDGSIEIFWATDEYLHNHRPEKNDEDPQYTGLYWLVEDVAEIMVDADDRALGLIIHQPAVFIEKLRELALAQEKGEYAEGKPRTSLSEWFI